MVPWVVSQPLIGHRAVDPKLHQAAHHEERNDGTQQRQRPPWWGQTNAVTSGQVIWIVLLTWLTVPALLLLSIKHIHMRQIY